MVIARLESWLRLDDVEYATLEWVDWFNQRRLLEPIGAGETRSDVSSIEGPVAYGGLIQAGKPPRNIGDHHGP